MSKQNKKEKEEETSEECTPSKPDENPTKPPIETLDGPPQGGSGPATPPGKGNG